MRETIRRSSNRYARKGSHTQAVVEARLLAARAEAQAALRDNRCPQCGKAVRRNLSLTGWVQCSQFGAPAFRADSNAAPCDWQGFTE